MTHIMVRATAHVVGPSLVNPMGHAVEMDADEFYELLRYAEDMETESRLLRNRNAALQAETNYYRRAEFARAREANLEWWLAVFKDRADRRHET